MNTREFNDLFHETVNNLGVLSSTKGIEYAGDVDRLSNFKRLGKELDMDPERVLWVYLTKHLDAIRSYLRANCTLSEPIEGRIDDAILYLILLKGLIQERGSVPVGIPESLKVERGDDPNAPGLGKQPHPGPIIKRIWDERLG
jgi:hypothetical protein